MREDATILFKMGKLVSQENNIYKARKLPQHVDPKTLWPSKAKLYSISKFGKYQSSKS
jgi:hypothetical protein